MRARSWKAAETRFARAMGVERKPCDGSRAGADFETTMFCFQLKYRKTFPSWLWAWLSGITGKAAESHRIGVLVLNKPRGRDEEALVVVRWGDWCALHGEPVIGSGTQAALEPAASTRRSNAPKSPSNDLRSELMRGTS